MHLSIFSFMYWCVRVCIRNLAWQFLPFRGALLYARKLKLANQEEWKAWCKSTSRPGNIPSRPDKVYKQDGWQGYGHWLGTGKVKGGTGRQHGFLPFKDALRFARALKLKGHKEWEEWRKSPARPSNIPTHPEKIYQEDGWQGYAACGPRRVALLNPHFLFYLVVFPHTRCILPYK